MECIKKITAELSGEMLFEYITAIQGDTSSRYVEITLLNNNRALVPPINLHYSQTLRAVQQRLSEHQSPTER